MNQFEETDLIPCIGDVILTTLSLEEESFIIFRDQVNTTVQILNNDVVTGSYKPYQTINFKFGITNLVAFSINGQL